MKLTIKPSISPAVRHKLEEALGDELSGVAEIDGGETMMDGSESSIYLYPIKGKTDLDLNFALTGHFEEPPWKLPAFDPDRDLPVHYDPAE